MHNLKLIWKMKRASILKATANREIMDNLRQEYLTNPDIMDVSRHMVAQLASGDRVTAEKVASQWLTAVEQLRTVRWQRVSHETGTKKTEGQWSESKSFQTRHLEKRFRSLKAAWRRRTTGTPTDIHDNLYLTYINLTGLGISF